MTVSVLIPWSDRPELSVTLAQNATVFHRLDAEVLVCNCGGNGSSLARMVSEIGNPHLSVVDCGSPVFNKSRAINFGAAAATRETLFVLDADILLDATFSVPRGVSSRECFVTLERVRERD